MVLEILPSPPLPFSPHSTLHTPHFTLRSPVHPGAPPPCDASPQDGPGIGAADAAVDVPIAADCPQPAAGTEDSGTAPAVSGHVGDPEAEGAGGRAAREDQTGPEEKVESAHTHTRTHTHTHTDGLPGRVLYNATPNSNTSVYVTWTAPSQPNTHPLLLQYEVITTRRDFNATSGLLPAHMTEFIVSSLSAGFDYQVYVVAHSLVGEGEKGPLVGTYTFANGMLIIIL